MALPNNQQAPRPVAITLLSNADYSNSKGELVRGKAGDTVKDCCAGDLKDLREAGVIVELDDEQQYAVEILRKMPLDKRTLVRSALGV
jgi:hypothetical protein